jgi:hypothetical protein
VTSQAAPIIEQEVSKMSYIEKLPPAPTTVIQESVMPMTTAAITTTSFVKEVPQEHHHKSIK